MTELQRINQALLLQLYAARRKPDQCQSCPAADRCPKAAAGLDEIGIP
jgi:hypothetical protein